MPAICHMCRSQMLYLDTPLSRKVETEDGCFRVVLERWYCPTCRRIVAELRLYRCTERQLELVHEVQWVVTRQVPAEYINLVRLSDSGDQS